MRIRAKLAALVTAAIASTSLVIILVTESNIHTSSQQEMSSYRQEKTNDVKRDLRNRVNTVYSLIEARYAELMSRSPDAPLEEILKQLAPVLEDIRRIRFEREYFWIHDTSKPIPSMIMHPIIPTLENHILDDDEFTTVIDGSPQNLFAAMRDVSEKSGEGYVEYSWPKPTQDGHTKERFLKVSYVKRFTPLGWLIGSGEYIDDIEQAIEQKSLATHQQVSSLVKRIMGLSLAIGLVAAGVMSLFAVTITRPVETLVRLASSISENEQNLSKRINLDASDEIGVLATAFNHMTSRLQRTLAQMREQRELLSSVLSHIPHAMFWKDRLGNYLGCNDAYAQIVGLSSHEQLVGKTEQDIATGSGDPAEAIAQEKLVIENGISQSGQEPLTLPDGLRVTYLVNRVPLRDQGGNIIGLLGILVALPTVDREETSTQA